MKSYDNILKEKTQWVWQQTLEIHRRAPETRIASSLSPIEVFVALFYGGILRHFPDDPYNEDRDRFVISKGHGSISMYPILADLGFFDMQHLNTVCQKGSFLGGIPDPVIPGYETVNGSLGHGLGVGCGMAVGLRAKQSDRNIFVLTGDGELHEGACWEAIMFASHHRLDNLNVIVDNNKIAMLGNTNDILSHGDLSKRFEAFNWTVFQTDGHDVSGVHTLLEEMTRTRDGSPKVLISNTIKGKGVPGLENQPLSHILAPKREILDDLLGQQRND